MGASGGDKRKTYFSWEDVSAGAVHVRIVGEDGVDRRARGGRDGQARVSRDDDVGEFAVLVGDAEAEFLQDEAVSSVTNAIKARCSGHLAGEEVRAICVDQIGVH